MNGWAADDEFFHNDRAALLKVAISTRIAIGMCFAEAKDSHFDVIETRASQKPTIVSPQAAAEPSAGSRISDAAPTAVAKGQQLPFAEARRQGWTHHGGR